jgi:hypothetical protein
VTITLEFNTAVDLSKFYLWNHSNNNAVASAISAGVKDFTLTFYSGSGGTGSPIGAVFSGTATAAPATGTYAAQTFNFGSTYSNVRSDQARDREPHQVQPVSRHCGKSDLSATRPNLKPRPKPKPRSRPRRPAR